MSRFEWGIVVWLLRWVALGFLPFELAPLFWKACPWPTLSETVWHAEAEWHPTVIIVEVFLAVLLLHLVIHLRAGALIAVVICAAIAVAAHFALGTP